jgi:hypothetical protein
MNNISYDTKFVISCSTIAFGLMKRLLIKVIIHQVHLTWINGVSHKLSLTFGGEQTILLGEEVV